MRVIVKNEEFVFYSLMQCSTGKSLPKFCKKYSNSSKKTSIKFQKFHQLVTKISIRLYLRTEIGLLFEHIRQ